MDATAPGLRSACDLLELYRRRELSPVEVAEDCLARIGRWNAAVGAFCVVDHEGAVAAAQASEARWARGEPCGPLDGVPATIKDIVLMRGFPTRRGSRATADAAPDAEDAPATARLREAGAVLLCKTTTPELGWEAVTDDPLGEVARNPWDTGRTAGGSSGGAAVAAALGMGALHLGTDGGGSIRIPAAFCGIVGLKPTFGRMPAWPLSPFGTVAHLGPMTRTVEDAALMLTVLALPDARDWLALPHEGRDWRAGIGDGVAGLRIAASERLGGIEVDQEVAAAFRRALGTLEALGARVEAVDPDLGAARDVFARHWFPAAARVLAGLPPERVAEVDPGLRAMADDGAAMGAAEIMDAQRERGALATTLHLLLGEFDLLATPAVAIPCVRGRGGGPRPGAAAALDRLGGLQLPLQPEPATRDQRSVWPHRGGSADRSPAGGAQVPRGLGPPRRAGVRAGRAAAAARGAPPCAGLTLPRAHAWLRAEQRFLGRVNVDGWCQAGSARHGVGPGARHDCRGQDAGLLLGGQPGRLQPPALHLGHHVRRQRA